MEQTSEREHGAEGAMTIVLTGATAGIGRATASALAGRAAHLILHGLEREDEVTGLLRAVSAEMRPGTRLDYFSADYGNPVDVARLVRRVHDVTDRIDLLVNNAGRPGAPTRTVNEAGTEMTLRANYLAPVQLTAGLIDLMGDRSHGRIVNVASATHLTATLHTDDLCLVRHRYSAPAAYAHSKLALVTYSRWLSSHRPRRGLDVVSMHPGVISTPLLHAMYRAAGDRPEHAAANIRHVASLRGDNGAYYDERTPAAANPQACDQPTQERLHDVTDLALWGGL
ncbi:SDR family NAD(P)-dependent oxidoreductase [Actinocorallia populi]|uniref:SDR family NAD(P)-dependent oxidoreductase n=1 Tax=Actinocorallia populi TaxID=2079200 RepID=UPI0013002F92|nr:SDR family NAD(P)-dependent oxidoreductase [Actinocorallia populi]